MCRMFITKMALPRRTFLRGMGVTLALPLLDAMVPALTAQSAARGAAAASAPSTCRTACCVDHWTPTTAGRRLRVHADPEAARAVPRSPDASSAT